ncbi:hypothetical protein LBMAG42_31700 [Deltaproteobacteria bacterium]|nr:hypothetical protein LBMAG42_31700 [Deltaproteobacteria bacterium]
MIFPEAVESSVEPLYERPILEGGAEVGTVFGYSFKLTVREQFDFHRYPFDTKDVWLRMWPKDFDSNVVLVPDLDAYPEIDPALRPGLDVGLVLAGWEPLRTYFQYREGNYSMDFGNRDYVGTEGFPELNFTVDVQRNFINTLVSDLIPLAVVTFLLYGVLRTLGTNHARIALTGFSFTSVLGACSGLVFVILLGHIQLRNALAGQEITYLEWYYFIIYIALVLTTVNAWMLIAEDPPPWIVWGDNLLARMAFWPLITTAIFLASAVYFFPRTEPSQADDASARIRSHDVRDRNAG